MKNQYKILKEENSNNSKTEFSIELEEIKTLKNINKINNDQKTFSFKSPKFLIENTIIIFFMFIGGILYYLSLKGCSFNTEKGENCLTKEGYKFYNQRAKECSISALISSVIFLLSLKKKINKFYAIFQFCFYTVNFFINKGSDLYNHGYYNTICFVLINIFVIFIFYIFIFFRYLFEHKKFIASLLISPFLIFFIYIFFRSRRDCEFWGLGLSGSKIQSKKDAIKNGDACYIIRPKRCFKKMLSKIEDLSKITNVNCEIQDGSQYKELIRFLPEKFKHTKNFGFPNTAAMNGIKDVVYKTFHKRVLNNFIDLDEMQKKNFPEVILRFNDKNEGTVFINVKPKKSLIKQRRKLYEKNKNKIKFDNVLIIYIDSISREQMFLSLPKTMKFIEKYYIKNEKKEKDFNTYQFLKYHNFAALTKVNAFPMFYGSSFNGKKPKNFINFYKQFGFITGQTNDYCGKEVFALNKKMAKKIDGIKYDHENVALFCDPNYSTPNFFFTVEKGPYSPRRRCLYGRDVFEYVFEYTKKFLEAYKNEKKIFKMGFNDAHESTGTVITYMDEYLKNFIEYYLKNHMTEKSMVILVSDHGNAMPDLNELLFSEDKEIEKTLGMLFLIYTNFKNDSVYNNSALILNEQTFVTPYEIYATLLDNLGLNSSFYNSKKSSPLDKKIDNSKRNCELYYQDFKFYSDDLELCRCRNV